MASQAWRLFWRWKSRHPGRPRLSAEARSLITAMSPDNPLWGIERIRDELLKLDITVSNRSPRKEQKKASVCSVRTVGRRSRCFIGLVSNCSRMWR
jgi:hypothetical protein